MSVTYTMTWANGSTSATNGGFVLTTDQGVSEQVTFPSHNFSGMDNPVHRAVADELAAQAGSATGTVTVTIS